MAKAARFYTGITIGRGKSSKIQSSRGSKAAGGAVRRKQAKHDAKFLGTQGLGRTPGGKQISQPIVRTKLGRKQAKLEAQVHKRNVTAMTKGLPKGARAAAGRANVNAGLTKSGKTALVDPGKAKGMITGIDASSKALARGRAHLAGPKTGRR